MPRYQSPNQLLKNLPKALARLKRREHSWHAAGTRSCLMKLLKSIYALYRSLRAFDLAGVGTKRLAMLAGVRWRAGRHPLRTIIDAASKADRRTKSRWMRALRYAWRERKRHNSLQDCFQKNGGIAGCANKWAALLAATRTPAGCVRVGGEYRVPKIPFFVDCELLTEDGYYMGAKLR